MKALWKSSGSDTATSLEETPATVDELVPLQQRRAQLSGRVRDLDAQIAELTSARTRALLAGDEISGPVGIAPLLEEKVAIAAVIEQLDRQIAEIDRRRAEASVAIARRKLQSEFMAAKESAETAHAEFTRGLRTIVFETFPQLLKAQRQTAAAARDAAARCGQHWNGKDLYVTMVAAGIGVALEHAARSEPRFYESE